jgi:hypothetical protein
MTFYSQRIVKKNRSIPKSIVWMTHIENDVRVPTIECSIAIFWPFDDMELLDAPDLKTWCIARLFPCSFSTTGVLANALLELFEGSHLIKVNVSLRLTSEPRRAIFESSMSYCVGLDRWAMVEIQY